MRTLLLSLLVLHPFLSAQNVCTVVAAGDGCAPLTVTLEPQGNGGNHDLTLLATGLHARAPGGMVWGMNAINVTLPGNACPLLSDFVWGHSFQTDTTGSYSYSRTWPNWFQGHFYMQMGTLEFGENGTFGVKSTDCKLARCTAP